MGRIDFEVPRQAEGRILRVLLNADLDKAVGYLAEPGPSLPLTRPLTSLPGRVAGVEPPQEEHWQWRLQMAERLAAQIDPERFGVKDIWVFGSTKNGTAGPGSDIDLLLHFIGTEEQKTSLLAWLEGWSLSLAEMNYVRTGYRSRGLLDARLITDRDIERRTSYAVKIGAVTDPARKLRMGTKGKSG